MKFFGFVLGKLSPWTVEKIARGLSILIFDVLRLRRSLILKNLDTAFGDSLDSKEKIKVGRDSVFHFLLTGFEFLRSESNDIAATIDFSGQNHLEKALAQGQGVYILCFHMGNWEAMGAKISRCYKPAYVPVKKVGGDSMNRFVSELRALNGFHTITRKKKGDGYRMIKDVLTKGEIVGFVMDQARPGEPRLPFFGAPAKTNTSLAAIWQRQPAPVVPSFITRSKIGHHTVHFFEEIFPQTTENKEDDILANSKMFNQVVEKCVRMEPSQYLWMHNRWK